jgi:hypothetical protein
MHARPGCGMTAGGTMRAGSNRSSVGARDRLALEGDATTVPACDSGSTCPTCRDRTNPTETEEDRLQPSGMLQDQLGILTEPALMFSNADASALLSCARRRPICRPTQILRGLDFFPNASHKSPTLRTRSPIVFTLKVCGPTSRRSISSHVQGAETGAPGLGRTL